MQKPKMQNCLAKNKNEFEHTHQKRHRIDHFTWTFCTELSIHIHNIRIVLLAVNVAGEESVRAVLYASAKHCYRQ